MIANSVVASLVSRESVKRQKIQEITHGAAYLKRIQENLMQYASSLPSVPSELDRIGVDNEELTDSSLFFEPSLSHPDSEDSAGVNG